MKQLWMDMSPTAINRTAIYGLARDTATHFAAITTGYRFGTRVYQNFELPAAQESVERKRVLQTLRHLSTPSTAGKFGLVISNRRRKRPRMLMFDPLYALFEPINGDDIVFVLDLTTLSHPEWHSSSIGAL